MTRIESPPSTTTTMTMTMTTTKSATTKMEDPRAAGTAATPAAEDVGPSPTRTLRRHRRRKCDDERRRASPAFLVRLGGDSNDGSDENASAGTGTPAKESPGSKLLDRSIDEKTGDEDEDEAVRRRESSSSSASGRSAGNNSSFSSSWRGVRRRRGSKNNGTPPPQQGQQQQQPLAELFARFLRQNPQEASRDGADVDDCDQHGIEAEGRAGDVDRKSSPHREDERAPSDAPSNSSGGSGTRSASPPQPPPLRRTYADFALLDRTLRTELDDDAYATLPKLPLELPPPPNKCSNHDLVALEDAAARRSASELGRYLRAAVNARGALRSAAVERFLSMADDDENENDDDENEMSSEGGGWTYTDYLLPPWSENDAAAAAAVGDDSNSNDVGCDVEIIPPWGSYVRTVSVPRGWHVLWRFAILPDPENDANGGSGKSAKNKTLASALGLEGVEFKLALETSSDGAAVGADADEADDSSSNCSLSLAAGGTSECLEDLDVSLTPPPSEASTVVTVGTGGSSFHSLSTIDIGRVVRNERVLLTSDRRSDVICGSYRYVPTSTDAAGDQEEDSDVDSTSFAAAEAGCTARLVFSSLGGGSAACGSASGSNSVTRRRARADLFHRGSSSRPQRLRLDAAVVPHDALEAAVTAAEDQNRSDEKMRRAPLLRAIARGGRNGSSTIVGGRSGEDVQLWVVPETATSEEEEDEEEDSSDDEGSIEKEALHDIELKVGEEGITAESADGDLSYPSYDREGGEVELPEHTVEEDEGECIAEEFPVVAQFRPASPTPDEELTPGKPPDTFPSTPHASNRTVDKWAAPAKEVTAGDDNSNSSDIDDDDDEGLLRHLRDEVEAARSERDAALSKLEDAASDAAAAAEREKEKEEEEEEELLRLRAELAEVRGTDRARAEMLESARDEVRALRSELSEAASDRRRRRAERSAERRRVERLRAALGDMTAQNRRLEARLIEEKRRMGTERRRMATERDDERRGRRELEERVKRMEEKEEERRRGGRRGKVGRRLWGGGSGADGTNPRRAESERRAEPLLGDREFVLLRARHPDRRLDEHLGRLRRRREELLRAGASPRRGDVGGRRTSRNAAELLERIEESIVMIVRTAPSAYAAYGAN